MGFQLRREVRDALPPGLLTSAERLLVLEIADQCNDRTREGWPGALLLAELTDLAPRSLQETLNRIGKKWLELRVPLGKDAKGRPYYSHAGKRTTFRFPPLERRRKGATDPGASQDAEGAMDAGPSLEEGATDPGERCDGSVEKVRQIRGPSPQGTPQKNTSQSSSRSTVAYVLEQIGSEDEDEAAWIIEQIKTRHHPRSIGAYIRAMPAADLLEMLEEHRAGSSTCERCNGTGMVWSEQFHTTTPCGSCAGEPDNTPCPIHPRNRAMACHSCWADVKAGQDPYRDRENERPDGWREQYRLDGQRRSSERESKVNGGFGRHKASRDRRRQSTGDRKWTEANEIADQIDAALGHGDQFQPRRSSSKLGWDSIDAISSTPDSEDAA